MHLTQNSWEALLETTTKTEAVFAACNLVFIGALELVTNGIILVYNIALIPIHLINETLTSIGDLFFSLLGICDQNLINPILAPINLVMASPQMILINPISCGTFSAGDLETLKAALTLVARARPFERILAHLGDQPYQIWFDLNAQTVNIREASEPSRTLSLTIIQGGLISAISLNGDPQTVFPPDFEACMWPCFMKSLEVSSSYDSLTGIRVIRQGLIETPDFHLEKLGQQILASRARPNIGVRFLQANLTEQVGIDAGGLSRDYIDDLCKGLTTNHGDLIFATDDPNTGDAHKMPKTAGAVIEGIAPNTSPREQSLYETLGAVMMYVYSSRGTLLTGRRFDDALFHAVFCLTQEEINTRFDHLADATLFKMCRMILAARNSSTLIVDFLQNGNQTNHQYAEAAAAVAENLPDDFEFDSTNPAHRRQVRDALRVNLLERFGRHLAPIHAIARGIQRAKQTWQIDGDLQAQRFSDTIQGTLDRQAIADALSVPEHLAPYIQTQARWLRAWILDPETPLDHLRAFLKFATGSSSLRNGQQIHVVPQRSNFVPTLVGHSCFGQIEIAPARYSYGEYNNHTQAAFVQALALALTDPGTYTMG